MVTRLLVPKANSYLQLPRGPNSLSSAAPQGEGSTAGRTALAGIPRTHIAHTVLTNDFTLQLTGNGPAGRQVRMRRKPGGLEAATQCENMGAEKQTPDSRALGSSHTLLKCLAY